MVNYFILHCKLKSSNYFSAGPPYQREVLADCIKSSCVTVNAFGRGLFYIMKGVFGNLMDKIELMGSDREEYKNKLLINIPIDQLPEKYGGFANFTAVAEYS